MCKSNSGYFLQPMQSMKIEKLQWHGLNLLESFYTNSLLPEAASIQRQYQIAIMV